MAGEGFDHKCFGCGHEIEDFEPHIHVGLDEWSGTHGGETFGLDDLFTFPFCSNCIEASDKGWEAEQHEVSDPAVKP